MTNDTDLANHALGLLGEAEISAITDQSSKAARTCRKFATEARQETLRMGRWNCATKRARLVETLPAPLDGYRHAYGLPSDFLRLMEVNGEAVKEADEYFEIEGLQLVTDETSVWIRYIAAIPIGACDALLKAAIAVRLASKIAIPLSGRIEQASAMEELFQRRLAEARGTDAKETGSAENSPWDRIFSRSRSGRARGGMRELGRLPGGTPANPTTPTGPAGGAPDLDGAFNGGF
jgi:hypothetical protein